MAAICPGGDELNDILYLHIAEGIGKLLGYQSSKDGHQWVAQHCTREHWAQ